MALENRYDCPIWTPLHLHRRLLREHVRRNVPELVRQLGTSFPSETLEVLDVGCGHMPYRELFASSERLHYVGADIPWANVEPEVRIDPESTRIDAASESFQGVVHFQTLEHVPDYRMLLSECHRLLKPGGWLFCTVPFAFEYHPVPGDYRRWTVQGIRKDLEFAGFEVSKSECVESDWVSLLTIMELYFASVLGYKLTKPLFLLMNLLGLLGANTGKRTLTLTVSAFAQKPFGCPQRETEPLIDPGVD